MRITENGISTNYLANINQAREKIVTLQSNLASGKRVQKPSDDPIASDTILRLQDALSKNAQYASNISDAQGMLDTTTNALGSVSDILMNIKNLVVSANNGTAADTLAVGAQNIDQMLGEIVDIANTKFNGKYIFGGTQTLDQPYTLASDNSSVTANTNGIDGTIEYPVGDGLNQQVNMSGQEAFGGTGLMDVLIQMRDTMKSGSPPTDAQSTALDNAFNHILDSSSKVANFSQSLDSLSANLDTQKTQLTQFLSNAQDTDVAEAVVQLQNSQLMLNAAIETAAKIIPKTLLDFLT